MTMIQHVEEASIRLTVAMWGAADYWTDKVGGCGWTGRNWSVEVVDLWQTGLDAAGRQGPAVGYNNFW